MPAFEFNDSLTSELPCCLFILRLAAKPISLAADIRLSVPVGTLAFATVNVDSHDRWPPSKLRSQGCGGLCGGPRRQKCRDPYLSPLSFPPGFCWRVPKPGVAGSIPAGPVPQSSHIQPRRPYALLE